VKFSILAMRHKSRNSYRWSLSLMAAIAVVWLCGCGSPPVFEFDRLDVSPNRESLTEFSLGHYEIPIPIASDRTSDHSTWSNRLIFAFDLHALVAPNEASHVADCWERHEGKVRDRVIQVCRNASVGDLNEPELGTLKARLMDAVQDQLGAREIRRLLLTEVVSQKL
jgi:hypothetical protein